MMKSNQPKKKRKLPKDVADLPDREVMEKLFGKHVMKAVDKVSGRDAETEEREGD